MGFYIQQFGANCLIPWYPHGSAPPASPRGNCHLNGLDLQQVAHGSTINGGKTGKTVILVSLDDFGWFQKNLAVIFNGDFGWFWCSDWCFTVFHWSRRIRRRSLGQAASYHWNHHMCWICWIDEASQTESWRTTKDAWNMQNKNTWSLAQNFPGILFKFNLGTRGINTGLEVRTGRNLTAGTSLRFSPALLG